MAKYTVRFSFFIIGYLINCCLGTIVYAQENKPNVLFILIDDLTKDIGLEKDSPIQTPNLLSLVDESIRFDRAYSQFPLCGPSRASIFSSLTSRTTGLTVNNWSKDIHVQNKSSQFGLKTMPAYFKANGYTTVGGGKLYHNSSQPGSVASIEDFSEVFLNDGRDATKFNVDRDFDGFPDKDANGNKIKGTYITEKSTYSILDHKAGKLGDKAKTWVTNYAANNTPEKQPFFMCLGFKKPHSPYSAPVQFWDMYDPNTIVLSDVQTPEGLTAEQLSYVLSKENSVLANHEDTWQLTFPTLEEGVEKNILHGYYACVSFVDYVIGDIIATLKAQNLYDNTIIVVTSDHGYKLGEYERLGKYTLQEIDLAVPFLIKSPAHAINNGKSTKALIGLTDIYPTLTNLCGIPTPNGLDGVSFHESLNNLEHSERDIVDSYFFRWQDDPLPDGAGISVVDHFGFRYTKYWDGSIKTLPANEDDIISEELYDHYHHNDGVLSITNIFQEQKDNVNIITDLTLPTYSKILKDASLVLGFEDYEINDYILPYPNPCKEYFQLGGKNNNIAKVILIGVNGKIIKEYKGTIDKYLIGEISTGLYFVKVLYRDSKNVSTLKMYKI